MRWLNYIDFSVVLVMIIIAGPCFAVVQQVAREAAKGVEQIRSRVTAEAIQGFQREHPRVGRILDWIEREVNLRQAVERTATAVSGFALNAVRGSLRGLLQLVLVFFFLFFFWDGKGWLLSTALFG